MCVHVMDMYAGRTVECKLPTGGSVCLGEDGSTGVLHIAVCDTQVVCGSDYEAQCPEF